MSEIKQEVENNISRKNGLISKKSTEISRLEAQIEILKAEKWEYEDLRDKISETESTQTQE